ncbi:hypothetical protein [Peribacillus alkalitolerans]|uniref:hypothetical protein n=1 Tax=Peribacillus alkalitolerans TaxID=1550385 RepID=UPI0013D437FC|nr:hypothetical protein [Peribacillus alkalitolerans]
MSKWLHVLVLFCMVVSMFIVAIPSPASACSCAERPSVESEFNRSKLVFSGVVKDIKENKSISGYITKSVLFEVSKTWKGTNESQIIIATGQGGGDCGYEFVKGIEYFVYANESSLYGDNVLSTGICDRTAELTSATEDLSILGEGKTPTKHVDLEREIEAPPFYWWLGIPVLIIGLFIWRKRK